MVRSMPGYGSWPLRKRSPLDPMPASDDVVIRRLILEQVVREHVCERLVSGGYVPMIEPGEPAPARGIPHH